MGVAELLLRLGCSLVAWLVLYAHCVWIAAWGAIDRAGGSTPWRVLFWWTPVVVVFGVLLRVGFAVPGVGRVLRLPLVLLVPLLLLAGRGLSTTRVTVNVDGGSICDIGPMLAAWWAPVLFATLLFIAAVGLQAWRRGA
jgi:hypothetical protein